MEVAKPEGGAPLSTGAPVALSIDADPPAEPQSQTDEIAENGEAAPVAPEFLIKHPLQNVWTLWYFEPIKGNWEKGQREITNIDTVEDFWSVYNHIKLASELKTGCDYSLFKEGIRPMWEDPKNVNGGKWLLTIEKRHRANDLDKIWLDICLCLIGEAFKHTEDVCGTIVNLRTKQDKISLWTSDASKLPNIMELGRDFKEKLKLNKIPIQYIKHADAMKAGSTLKYTAQL